MNTDMSSPLQPVSLDLDPHPQKAALLVIDMQKPYFESPPLADEQTRLVARCNELITAFKEKSLPIIYTRTVHGKNKQSWTLNMRKDNQGFAYAGHQDVAFAEGLSYDASSAITINKTRDSAFIATDLEVQLRGREITTFVICGVSTHSCVGLTAAEAYARNYHVILAQDAIASNKKQYHEVFLEMLSDEYQQPRMTNKQIMAFISGEIKKSAHEAS